MAEITRWPFCEPPEARLTALQRPPVWRGVLIASLMVLAIIGFWPSPVDAPIQGQLASRLKFLQNHGFPLWVNYSLVEESANVVLFIPLGVTVGLAFPDKRWWQNAAFGTMVSGCI
ncbi:hypothetical protein [Arthrobacter sp. 92]|uniref:hypothetical protein n=1 Tax=Arthrobacter sp. 92 TaxID=3418175 RepID=UPI003CFC3E1E